MRVPEPPVQAGQLGELRGEVRSRMERRHGKVAPDEAEAIEAVQECLHRSTGLEAVRASEIPILDERQLRAARAGDVIALSDRRQGARGRGVHPTRVLCASIAPTSPARTMVASTSLNASVELARAIASMHTILRTGPVIASGLDDQRYALGDWRSGPPRRWSRHATLTIRNADQTSVTAVVQRCTSDSLEGEGFNAHHNEVPPMVVLHKLMARGIVPVGLRQQTLSRRRARIRGVFAAGDVR